MRIRKAFILVDGQNDFVQPLGALSIPNAREAIPNILKLYESGRFDFKLATRDWHPSDHISFAATHGAVPFSVKELNYGPQVMWTTHCVAGTHGAQLIPEFNELSFDAIFNKGTDANRECYSVFNYCDNEKTKFNRMIKSLLYVNGRELSEIVVCGYAGDFCVEATALGAKDLMPKVTFIDDAVAYVDVTNRNATHIKLKNAGVSIMTTDEWLNS